MASTTDQAVAEISSDALDQIFLDCAELEALIVSIRRAMDTLDPSVDTGLVTAEHLMNLAFRIENAQRGLIAVAHQVSDAATSMIQRRQMKDAVRWDDATAALASMPGCTKN